MYDITVIRMDNFHGNKSGSRVPIAVTLFKKRNLYIVNFITVVYSAEDCYADNVKI